MRPGRGSRYFWYVSAAVSLVNMHCEPAQAKKQAIDRVAKLLYKTLSLQDEPDAETLATEVSLGYSCDTTQRLMTVGVAGVSGTKYRYDYSGDSFGRCFCRCRIKARCV
jgi:hypothetical protein